jgi:hypothetical protein
LAIPQTQDHYNSELTHYREVAFGRRYHFMKKAKLPLPLWILILATLFLLANALGERIGHPAAASRTQPSKTVEQQQAAIIYVRVMSWLSRVIAHPGARTVDNVKYARPVEPISAEVYPVAAHRVQLGALNKSTHHSKSQRRLSCRILAPAQQSQSSREVPSAAGVMRDSSATANGS